MAVDLATRLLVIGNSGSGKSTLARRAGTVLKLPSHDLDHFHWLDDGRKRDETEAQEMVSEVASGAAWVIEGVYGWLAEVALPRATKLIWLDLTWADCRNGLLDRGLRRGMTLDDQEALISWAGAYWTRKTPSSFAGHEQMFDVFSGDKLRLTSRAEIDGFVQALQAVESRNS